MKTGILALCLAVVATVLWMAPPAFARVDEPMFGLDWRPTVCADAPGDYQVCTMLFDYLSAQSNSAIDQATDHCNGGNSNGCFVSYYSGLMGEWVGANCEDYYVYYGEGQPQGEVAAWCVQLSNLIIHQTIGWPDDPNCAC